MTIRKSVLKAYNKLPDRFEAARLCNLTRDIIGRRPMDGTILRRLRELRADGVLMYKAVDPSKAIYQKEDIWTSGS